MLWVIAIELAVVIFQLWNLTDTLANQTIEMRRAGTAKPEGS